MEKVKNFSFFRTRGGSGYIRGTQMANYLGGKDNPTEGYEDDLCIYVKVTPPHHNCPEITPKHVYADVDDSWKSLEFLKTHPEFGVIAISETCKDHMSDILKRDDIVFIPHQHCNFERRIRPERPVRRVGIIGCKSSFQYPADDFRKEVEKLGMELVYEEDYWNTYRSDEKQEMRLNVADFYHSLDVQVVWRPRPMYKKLAIFANPNKMGNSASFGIPTVSFPEPSYVREFDGCFLPAKTIKEMLEWLRQLKDDPLLYQDIAQRNLEKAEEYHIDNIAKKYLALK